MPNRASSIAPTAASSNHRQIQARGLVLDPPISVSTSRTIVVPLRLRVPVSSHRFSRRPLQLFLPLCLHPPDLHNCLPDPEQSLLPPSTTEDALSGSGVEAGAAETVRSDCPADEGQGVLRPGSASRSRHNEKEAPQTSLPSKPIVLVPSTMVLLSAPPRVPGMESFEATIVAQNVF